MRVDNTYTSDILIYSTVVLIKDLAVLDKSNQVQDVSYAPLENYYMHAWIMGNGDDGDGI